MLTYLNKHRKWLLPAVLILFLLEIITFPFVVGFTLADRSESPDRVLTYTQGKLTWDSAAEIDSNGVARLSLFKMHYQNVDSDNDDRVVAPGTENTSIVRLLNKTDKTIDYTAILYRIHSTDILPVEAGLNGENFTDTDRYTLPEGVNREHVIRAVSGTVDGSTIQDFDIDWLWRFYDSDEQDVIDTWLGDKAADGDADDITIGLYIVVVDEGDEVTPTAPKTGDARGIYIVLICISGILLLLLIFDRRRNRRCEE